MSVSPAKLKLAPVRDRGLRLIQYLCKFLSRYASPDQLKFLTALAGNLSDTRMGMNLCKWLGLVIQTKNIVSGLDGKDMDMVGRGLVLAL